MRSVQSLLWTILSAAALAGGATAQVAVLGAPGGGAPWNNDVAAKLLASGVSLGPVTVIDVSVSTPTLAQLQAYRAVLVYSDMGFQNAAVLGDNLKSYVDGGGGVVVSAFTNAVVPLGGAWNGAQYDPIEPTGYASGVQLTLGTRLLPAHPLFTVSAVGSFDGGTASYRSTGNLAPNSTRIANWSNGSIFAAERDGLNGRVVGLNFFPPSSTVRADLWAAATDGDNLMANALFYAAGRRGVAVLGAPFGGAAWNADVQAKLVASGVALGPVTVVDVATSTPTLAELNAYEAVLVYSDMGFQNPVALGTNLKDYVDGGGGVVLCTFATASVPLGGAWAAALYDPIVPAGQTQGVPLQLGSRLVPGHALFSTSPVANFDGGQSSFHGTGALAPMSTRLANWSNGDILAAERMHVGGRIVGLNFFPPSSSVRPDLWNALTDGDNLMANALAYAGAASRVAILGAPWGGASWNADVQAKIAAAGVLHGGLTVIDVSAATPTLAELRTYGGVLVYSDILFQNATVMGDNLHDYVDLGGGVVVSTFTNASVPLGGRWASGQYDPITTGGQYQGTQLQLGARYSLAHPLFAISPVVSFDGGTSSYHSSGVLALNSTRLADYSNGDIFAAERLGLVGRVLSLNFYPPSSDARADFWLAGTDGDNLMANALVYVSAFVPSSAVYCDAKVNGLGCLPSISSTGFASSALPLGFVLRAVQVRNVKPGLLLYSSSGRASVPFNGGTLCLAAPIRRSVPLASGGSPLPVNDCSGVYAIDMNAFAHGLLGGTPSAVLLTVGRVIDCQFWGRDPGFPAPNNSTLSNALEYIVTP